MVPRGPDVRSVSWSGRLVAMHLLLLVTSATLVVTGALLVVTKKLLELI